MNVAETQEKWGEQTKFDSIPIRSIESTINRQKACMENWNESPSHEHENDSGHNY
ncbi:MAG: hypothetical protein AB1643_00655 [Patescibacteria group bacterium]